MANKKTIIISGPTATGKSNLAIEIAKISGGTIVNFDSLLFYKELNIGTAKPTTEELLDSPHFMINCCSLQTHLNAADYCKIAHPIIEKLHHENKPVILVGGSGFYLRALINGMYESITTPDDITQRSNKLYQLEGISPFIQELKQVDPTNYQRLHANDHYRIRRAVEHWWTTGKAFSQSLTNDSPFKHTLADQLGWDLLHLHLDIPKHEHWEIILKRTHQMIENGLIQEVKGLLLQGFSGNEKPLLAIGYKETQEYLQGKINTIEELIQLIAIATRQLAKAQRTWFNKIEDKKTFHPFEQREQLWQTVTQFLKQ